MTPETPFSLDGIILPERGKIPRNPFIVVADDDPVASGITAEMARRACAPLNLEPKGLHVAQDVKNLFQLLMGNERQPADIVLCDQHFFEDAWVPDFASFSKLAGSQGVDFSPFIGERPIGMPAALLYPNGVHFAMLARIFGYKGLFLLVSNNPPEPKAIIRELRELSLAVPSYKPIFPLDGFACKGQTGTFISFGTEIEPNGYWVNECVPGDLSDAIAHLLRPRIAS